LSKCKEPDLNLMGIGIINVKVVFSQNTKISNPTCRRSTTCRYSARENSDLVKVREEKIQHTIEIEQSVPLCRRKVQSFEEIK
jgi:hypothetical protein